MVFVLNSVKGDKNAQPHATTHRYEQKNQTDQNTISSHTYINVYRQLDKQTVIKSKQQQQEQQQQKQQ